MKVRQLTKDSLRKYIDHPAEFFGSLSLMLLGIWLIIYPSLPAYAFLIKLSPFPVWGPLIFIIGFTSRMWLLGENRSARWVSVFAVLFVRIFLMVATGVSTRWISPTIPEHIAWIIVAAWSYFGVSTGPVTL